MECECRPMSMGVSFRCIVNPRHQVEVRSSQHLVLNLPKVKDELDAWFQLSSSRGQWSDNAVKVCGWSPRA
jgi:hypothetical protein